MLHATATVHLAGLVLAIVVWLAAASPTVGAYARCVDGTLALEEHIVTKTADGAFSVFATDVDGDSRVDVLAASRFDNAIRVFYNRGDTQRIFFKEHTLTTVAKHARYVFAADMTGDSSTDFLSASFGDSTIRLFVNRGGVPAITFDEHLISAGTLGAVSVYAVTASTYLTVDI